MKNHVISMSVQLR